ncbi:hypothetical protein [Mesorhizobium sp. BE184]|uniref:hypothetical protein n=1 Tax=Mesorhizobium sp. BE184 TaxID=2817714 RepID=UPI0028644B02|nr:hypothetical protein [Mesorhizobium sp. BE184]MDR7033575.1 hypothetical protein [Mesorhizobium sp. BE184]
MKKHLLESAVLRPAKTPAANVLAGLVLLFLATPAAADAAYEASIYRSLKAVEIRINEALKARNLTSLRRQADKLGLVVDRAFARRERDRTKLSDCEKASAFLDHIAIYAERGFFYKKQGSEFGQIVLDGIDREIENYTGAMRSCERLLELPQTERPPFARSLKGPSDE